MTTSTTPPSIAELFASYLATRADAASAPAGCEVEPHEVAAGFRVDHQAAWADATAALGLKPTAAPPEWAALVASPVAVYAVPMAAGSYPQRVRDVSPLLARLNPAALRPAAGTTQLAAPSGLAGWIARESEKPTALATLLAAGVARAAGDLARAAELLTAAGSKCATDAERAALANERAALAWAAGDAAGAVAAWDALPDAPAVRFNRGMARLFLGRFAEARTDLDAAVAALPDGSGWRDLAELYRTLADLHA